MTQDRLTKENIPNLVVMRSDGMQSELLVLQNAKQDLELGQAMLLDKLQQCKAENEQLLQHITQLKSRIQSSTQDYVSVVVTCHAVVGDQHRAEDQDDVHLQTHVHFFVNCPKSYYVLQLRKFEPTFGVQTSKHAKLLSFRRTFCSIAVSKSRQLRRAQVACSSSLNGCSRI